MDHASSPGSPMAGRSAEPVRRRWVPRLIGCAVALAVTTWVAVGWSDPPQTGRAAGDSVIQQYPRGERAEVDEFSGRLLDGVRFSSGDLRGRVTVYNVWGSWCVPCRIEAPALIEVAERFGDDVSFIGINVRDGLAAAKAFERNEAVPYPSVRADDSSAALLAFPNSLAVAAVPTSIVVDRQGRIAARVVGPTTYSTLKGLVEDVLAEA